MTRLDSHPDELLSFLPLSLQNDSPSRSSLPFLKTLKSRAAALVHKSSRTNLNSDDPPPSPARSPRPSQNSSFFSLSRGSCDSNSTSTLPRTSVTSFFDDSAMHGYKAARRPAARSSPLRSHKSGEFVCPPARPPSVYHKRTPTAVNSDPDSSGAQPYDLEFHATVVGSLLTSVSSTEDDYDSDADADSTIEGPISPYRSQFPTEPSHKCELPRSQSTTSLGTSTASSEYVTAKETMSVCTTETSSSIYVPLLFPFPPSHLSPHQKSKWRDPRSSRSLLPIGPTPSPTKSPKLHPLRTARSELTLSTTRSPASSIPPTPSTAASDAFPITPVSPLFFLPSVLVTDETDVSISLVKSLPPIPPPPAKESQPMRCPGPKRPPPLAVRKENGQRMPGDVDWTLSLPDPAAAAAARARVKSKTGSGPKAPKAESVKTEEPNALLRPSRPRPRSRHDDWTLSLPDLSIASRGSGPNPTNTVPFPRTLVELPEKPLPEPVVASITIPPGFPANPDKRDSAMTCVGDAPVGVADTDWDGETVGKRHSTWSARMSTIGTAC